MSILSFDHDTLNRHAPYYSKGLKEARYYPKVKYFNDYEHFTNITGYHNNNGLYSIDINNNTRHHNNKIKLKIILLMVTIRTVLRMIIF